MSNTPYEGVRMDQWNRRDDGSQVYYVSGGQPDVSLIKRLVEEINPSCIYLNSMFSRYFTLLPLTTIDRGKYKIVLAPRGMLSQGALSVKPLKKKLFFLFAKLRGLFNHVIFQATDEEEKKQILTQFPDAVVKIASNLPRRTVVLNAKRLPKISGEVRLLNVARVAPEKNLLFALESLKPVKGNVRFDHYGTTYDLSYAAQCSKIAAALPANISVANKGEVPAEEIPLLMEGYHFLLLPSLGENFGHIILEALSAGMPVIISDRTPWKDLSAKKAGWDISLNDPLRFTQIIEQCAAMDEAMYSEYSKGAFELASSFVNDKTNILLNKELFL